MIFQSKVASVREILFYHFVPNIVERIYLFLAGAGKKSAVHFWENIFIEKLDRFLGNFLFFYNSLFIAYFGDYFFLEILQLGYLNARHDERSFELVFRGLMS